MKKKFNLGFIFIALLSFTLTMIFGLTNPARNTYAAWSGSGAGTSADPYQIGTLDELNKFRDIVNGENGETQNVSACAKLTADIVASPGYSDYWAPIASSTNPYNGVFDGNGHSIKVNINTDSYAGEKIIFWGGSNSLDDMDIQTSPFIVTDKGSIFANRGEFKGTVITNSLISNARIETPIIYGTGNNPSLRIYDTDNSKMGIGFYKADETLTLNISNVGFSHYYNNILTSFIQFSDNDNSIYFTGTSFTAGNTIYSSQLIQDGQANIQINGNSGGNVKLVYNTNSGVEVTEGLVRNFGGQVVNEGTMQIVDNTKYLKYTVNNGYYCLYVES